MVRLNPFYRAVEGEHLRYGIGWRNLSTRRRVWWAVFIRFTRHRVFRVLLIHHRRGAYLAQGCPRTAVSLNSLVAPLPEHLVWWR